VTPTAWRRRDDRGVTDGVREDTTEEDRRALRERPQEMTIGQEMTMEMVITQQSTENMQYVRELLGQKQPGFAAALKSASTLAEQELQPPGMPGDISARDDS
jgi:hypothetical protein